MQQYGTYWINRRTVNNIWTRKAQHGDDTVRYAAPFVCHIIRLTVRRFDELRQTDRLVRQIRTAKHLIHHIPIEHVVVIVQYRRLLGILMLFAQQLPQLAPYRTINRPRIVPQYLFNVLFAALADQLLDLGEILQRLRWGTGRYHLYIARVHQRRVNVVRLIWVRRRCGGGRDLVGRGRCCRGRFLQFF